MATATASYSWQTVLVNLLRRSMVLFVLIALVYYFDSETGRVLTERNMRAVRGGRIAMIFQEPMTSLNPVMTIGAQIAESVEQHKRLRGESLRRRVLELLNDVGIPDPVRRYGEYPHQSSGGPFMVGEQSTVAVWTPTRSSLG